MFGTIVKIILILAVFLVFAMTAIKSEKDKKESKDIINCVVAFYRANHFTRDEQLEYAELFVEMVVKVPDSQLERITKYTMIDATEHERGRMILNDVINHYDGFSEFYACQTTEQKIKIKRLKNLL